VLQEAGWRASANLGEVLLEFLRLFGGPRQEGGGSTSTEGFNPRTQGISIRKGAFTDVRPRAADPASPNLPVGVAEGRSKISAPLVEVPARAHHTPAAVATHDVIAGCGHAQLWTAFGIPRSRPLLPVYQYSRPNCAAGSRRRW
jgi:hypothetical protein